MSPAFITSPVRHRPLGFGVQDTLRVARFASSQFCSAERWKAKPSGLADLKTVIVASSVQRLQRHLRRRGHDLEQRRRRTRGVASVLLPVLQRFHAHPHELCKVALRQTRLFSHGLGIRGRHLETP